MLSEKEIMKPFQQYDYLKPICKAFRQQRGREPSGAELKEAHRRWREDKGMPAVKDLDDADDEIWDKIVERLGLSAGD